MSLSPYRGMADNKPVPLFGDHHGAGENGEMDFPDSIKILPGGFEGSQVFNPGSGGLGESTYDPGSTAAHDFFDLR